MYILYEENLPCSLHIYCMVQCNFKVNFPVPCEIGRKLFSVKWSSREWIRIGRDTGG